MKPYALRLEDDLHEALTQEAARRSVSLNQLIQTACRLLLVNAVEARRCAESLGTVLTELAGQPVEPDVPPSHPRDAPPPILATEPSRVEPLVSQPLPGGGMVQRAIVKRPGGAKALPAPDRKLRTEMCPCRIQPGTFCRTHGL